MNPDEIELLDEFIRRLVSVSPILLPVALFSLGNKVPEDPWGC
jgi:hypothetical protein